MEKHFAPSQWDFGMPSASLVDVHRSGRISSDWLVKRAGIGDDDWLRDVAPSKGNALVHLIAVGDAEYYGPNRNLDYWYGKPTKIAVAYPDWEQLQLCDGSVVRKGPGTFTTETKVGNDTQYRTFETHAAVYRDHKNKPDYGDKVWGSVKKAFHNPYMHRIELLVELPEHEWADDLEKIATDRDLAGFSMAANVSHDVCTASGLIQPTRAKYGPYCDTMRGRLLKQGHQVGMVNDGFTYFDISRVGRNADRIAVGLRKVAEDGTAPVQHAPVLDKTAADTRREILIQLAAEEAKLAEEGSPCGCSHPLSGEISRDSLRKLVQEAKKDDRLADIFGMAHDEGVVFPLDVFQKTVFPLMPDAEADGVLSDAKNLLPWSANSALSALDTLSGCELFDSPGPAAPTGGLAVVREIIRSLKPSAGRSKLLIAKSGPSIQVTVRKMAADRSSDAQKLVDLYSAYRATAIERMSRGNTARRDELVQQVARQGYLQSR